MNTQLKNVDLTTVIDSYYASGSEGRREILIRNASEANFHLRAAVKEAIMQSFEDVEPEKRIELIGEYLAFEPDGILAIFLTSNKRAIKASTLGIRLKPSNIPPTRIETKLTLMPAYLSPFNNI